MNKLIIQLKVLETKKSIRVVLNDRLYKIKSRLLVAF